MDVTWRTYMNIWVPLWNSREEGKLAHVLYGHMKCTSLTSCRIITNGRLIRITVAGNIMSSRPFDQDAKDAVSTSRRLFLFTPHRDGPRICHPWNEIKLGIRKGLKKFCKVEKYGKIKEETLRLNQIRWRMEFWWAFGRKVQLRQNKTVK